MWLIFIFRGLLYVVSGGVHGRDLGGIINKVLIKVSCFLMRSRFDQRREAVEDRVTLSTHA